MQFCRAILATFSSTCLSSRYSFSRFNVVQPFRKHQMWLNCSLRHHISTSAQSDISNELKKEPVSNYIKNSKTIEILKKYNIQSFFPIQAATYKLLFNGKDLMASDRTGSGKTFAYSIPIIERLRENGAFNNYDRVRNPKFIVLCPTRELAVQVCQEISKLSQIERDFKVAAIYGGDSMNDQRRLLASGVDIVVATPGRLIAFLEGNEISFKDLKTVCIDEADTMLQKGFKDDVQKIFNYVKNATLQKTQNIMFSATVPGWVDEIARRYFSKNKETVSMISDAESRSPSTVTHYAIETHTPITKEMIAQLIDRYAKGGRTLIFVQMKMNVNKWQQLFQEEAVCLHGDISQNVRTYNLLKFKEGRKKIMIATDVASRGLDIPDVELVIQLAPPISIEPYIHRSGRSGRAGKPGTSITFFDSSNADRLARIESEVNIKLKILKQSDSNSLVAFCEKLYNLKKQIQQTQLSDGQRQLFGAFINDLGNKTEDTVMKIIKVLYKPPSSAFQEESITLIAKMKQQKNFSPAKLKEQFGGIDIKIIDTKDSEIRFSISSKKLLKAYSIINKSKNFKIEVNSEVQSTRSLRSFNTASYSSRRPEKDSRHFENKISQSSYRQPRQDFQQKRSTSNYNEDRFQEQNQQFEIMVLNIPENVNRDQMANEMQNNYGLQIKSIRVRENKRNPGTQLAYVKFDSKNMLQKALKTKLVIAGEICRSLETSNRT